MFTNNLIYVYHGFNDGKLFSFSLYVCSLACGVGKNELGMCVYRDMGGWKLLSEGVFTMVCICVYHEFVSNLWAVAQIGLYKCVACNISKMVICLPWVS